mgnify:CR=1 FL=1
MSDRSKDLIWRQLARISREIDDELGLLHDVYRRMNMSSQETGRRFERIERKRREYQALIEQVRFSITGKDEISLDDGA